MAGLIYLASPYSHNDPAVMRQRYEAARDFTVKWIKRDLLLFSPIVYGYCMEAQIGTDYKSWQTFNDNMIASSMQVWVLQIPGWRDSLGVEHECKYAVEIGKPLHFIEP